MKTQMCHQGLKFAFPKTTLGYHDFRKRLCFYLRSSVRCLVPSSVMILSKLVNNGILKILFDSKYDLLSSHLYKRPWPSIKYSWQFFFTVCCMNTVRMPYAGADEGKEEEREKEEETRRRKKEEEKEKK